MQNKRITEGEKQRLREMLERERARQEARPQRRKITKKLSCPWAVAAFICCILPAVLIFLTFFLLFLGIDFTFLGLVIFTFLGLVIFYFPFIVPPLGIISIVLAIVAIIKREVRGKTLAMVAIVIGILEIGAGLYILRELQHAFAAIVLIFQKIK